VTEPTRCLGRSERDALQRAHACHPGGFEILEWRRSQQRRKAPVELLVRPIGTRASTARARLRLLASVTALRAQAAEGRFDPASVRTTAVEPSSGSREVWAFLGAPGSGVTRVVCGLAARLNGRDRCNVGLLSAGDEMHASDLRGFADAMGLPLHVAPRSAEIADVAASLGHRSLVLVDFPGVGPRDGDRLGMHARALQALAPQAVCAVLAADADEVALRRQLEVFIRVGANCVALTRVDLAARLEPALRVIAATGLPVAWVGHGSGTSSDLAPVSTEWIERACHRQHVMG
jgi:flagellar biosynthesis GTPase FlhF